MPCLDVCPFYASFHDCFCLRCVKQHCSPNLHFSFVLYLTHSGGCQHSRRIPAPALEELVASWLVSFAGWTAFWSFAVWHLGRLLQNSVSPGKEIVLDFFLLPFLLFTSIVLEAARVTFPTLLFFGVPLGAVLFVFRDCDVCPSPLVFTAVR